MAVGSAREVGWEGREGEMGGRRRWRGGRGRLVRV